MLKRTPVTWHTELSTQMPVAALWHTGMETHDWMDSLCSCLSVFQSGILSNKTCIWTTFEWRKPFWLGLMFAQAWDCAAAGVGDGWATAATLKTPVNVLVILEPLGWETDSVKKHLSTLRSSEWFTAYLDICKELLHLDILSHRGSVCSFLQQ